MNLGRVGVREGDWMFSALEADKGMPQTKEKPAKCKITQLLCPQRYHKLLGPGEMRVTEGACLVRNETVAAPLPKAVSSVQEPPTATAHNQEDSPFGMFLSSLSTERKGPWGPAMD